MDASVNVTKVVTGSPTFMIDLTTCNVSVRVGSGADGVSFTRHLTQVEFTAIAPILKSVVQAVPNVGTVSDPVYVS